MKPKSPGLAGFCEIFVGRIVLPASLVFFLLPWVLSWSFDFPPRPTAPPSDRIFRDAAEDLGLKFHHFTGATGEFYMPEIVGAGVAVFDYDNDGDLDVYLVQGTILDPSKTMADALFPPPPGWQPGNRLFRNLLTETGKLKFVDVTEQAGVGSVGYGMGVAVGDYDNDGYQDLYVTNFGPNVLYRNQGDGSFAEVTRQAGVDDPRWSSSAAWLDYDRDGHLDLFVANYLDFTVKGNRRCFTPAGEPDYCAPTAYRPQPSKLFRNLGDGKFANVTEEAGIASAFGPGLGVACADFNADGWIDVYVANDGQANNLWLNQGDGTFRDVALLSGVAYNSQGLAQAGMGVAVGDFDNDGDEDLAVTNLTTEGCALYRNDGRGSFDEASAQAGLLRPTVGHTGFGTKWFDYDNDGDLDLFSANGAVYLIESLRAKSSYPYHQINQLFHNEGDGRRFQEVTAIAGPVFELSEVSRGAAFGDLDNDGDIDLVVTNNNGPVRMLLNGTDGRPGRHWLQVRLEAAKGNRFGIGAGVEIHQPGRKIFRRVGTDGSYLSAGDVCAHFGLGENARVKSVAVNWPDGSQEVWDKVEVDRTVTLRQGTGRKQ